jgi:preprotein translocase subunit SecA
MNKQRENIYTLRRQLLEGRVVLDDEEAVGTHDYVMTTAEDVIDSLLDTHCDAKSRHDEWDVEALKRDVEQTFGLAPEDLAGVGTEDQSRDQIRDALWDLARHRYADKLRQVGGEVLRLPDDVRGALLGQDRLPAVSEAPEDERDEMAGRAVIDPIERNIMLQIVDTQWKDHLYSLDHLKDGIGLRGYGQRDPLVEYKKESYALFQGMRERVDDEILRYLWRLRPIVGDGGGAGMTTRAPQRRAAPMTTNRGSAGGGSASAVAARAAAAAMGEAPRPARVGGDDAQLRTVRRDEPKVGRNDPCPCGSGKKYKKCHGA